MVTPWRFGADELSGYFAVVLKLFLAKNYELDTKLVLIEYFRCLDRFLQQKRRRFHIYYLLKIIL